MKNLYTKTTISHNYVEVIEQEFPPTRSSRSGGRRPGHVYSYENYDRDSRISVNRSKKKIRRLLECNFYDKYSFLTLTFKQTEDWDTTNLEECYQQFSNFKKRVNYYLKKNKLPPFKYVGVTEFQESGNAHYHLVCNLMDVNPATLENLWGNGWISVNTVNSSPLDNQKISSYLSKGIADYRLCGKKKYFCSRGLVKPTILDGNASNTFLSLLSEIKEDPLESGSYQSPFFGEVNYQNYYIKNAEELVEYARKL